MILLLYGQFGINIQYASYWLKNAKMCERNYKFCWSLVSQFPESWLPKGLFITLIKPMIRLSISRDLFWYRLCFTSYILLKIYRVWILSEWTVISSKWLIWIIGIIKWDPLNWVKWNKTLIPYLDYSLQWHIYWFDSKEMLTGPKLAIFVIFDF